MVDYWALHAIFYTLKQTNQLIIMSYANILISFNDDDHDAITTIIENYTTEQLSNVYFIDTTTPMKAAEIAEDLRDGNIKFLLYHVSNKDGAAVLANDIDADLKIRIRQILMEV